MADVKLNHIYKVYPNGTKAVNDFTMDIKDKEFIVFVGPSKKETTLSERCKRSKKSTESICITSKQAVS